MSITPGPTSGPPGNSASTSNANAPRQPKKKKSFLSFLSCCGVPDDGNAVESNENVPAKITKVPSNRPTTASRPEPSTVNQRNSALTEPQTEKDALQKEDTTIANEGKSLDPNRNSQPNANLPPVVNGELNRPVDARDQPLPELPKETESSNVPESKVASPAAPVQSLARPEPSGSLIPAASSQDQRDGEGDSKMEDSEPLPAEEKEAPVPATRDDETAKPLLPPPPPVPQPGSSEESAPDATEQKWLLPPIAPRFQGKKCLVLDLDETLVHSSFKVKSKVLIT